METLSLSAYTGESVTMENEQELDGGRFDPLPEIKEIVRECIQAGLLTGVSVAEYNHSVATLEGPELEEYLQNLWDQI